MPGGARIPYERYFDVSMVPEAGMSLRSYEFLRRLTDDAIADSPVFDAHAHIGRDLDGRSLALDELLADLDRYRVAGAVVFPFNDPDQGEDFARPNERIWAAYERAPGRLVPFMRLNPNGPWEHEYERCVSRGHRGVKLHPRAQDFELDDPAVLALFARAAVDGLPVLVHTGYGMAAVSRQVARIATDLPDLSIILAHSSFIDMPRAVKVLADHPRVYFETSVVRVYDLFTVLTSVDPRRVVYGSDLPYATSAISLQALSAIGRFAGLDGDDFADLFGGNLLRILQPQEVRP